MKSRIKLIILLMPLFILSNPVKAQKVGTTSFQFLKVIPNARSVSMGESFVSVASTSETLFWNPAGLVSVSDMDFTVSHLAWFVDTKIFSFTAGYNLGNIGSIGLYGMYTDYGSIKATSVEQIGFNPDGTFHPGFTGEILNPSSFMIGLSYARKLTDKFSFGLSAKVASENLVLEKTTAIIFDGGLIYDTGYKTLKIGAVIRQFGPEVKFVEKKYALPQTFEIGISGFLISPSNSLLINSLDNRLLFTCSLVHPRDYKQQGNMGMEYTWSDLISLRAGYKFNYDEETYTAGFGINYNGFRLDYAFCPYGEYLNSVHRFSLGYSVK